jgi:predicted lactoylglutathione lyase
MQLGAFSISLAVKDIHASLAFYQKLGFTQFAGHIEQKWIILKNGSAIIGLFEGMFEKNTLTFNPGWDENAQAIDPFDDVRILQKQLKSDGITLIAEANEEGSGPAHIMLTDPDGNPILIDQHR